MEKTRTEPFFLVLFMIAYQGALTPRKLLCPKKSLVARLGWLLLLISFASVYTACPVKAASIHTKIVATGGGGGGGGGGRNLIDMNLSYESIN